MPKIAQTRIQSDFFTWTFFRRKGVYYADGRSNPQRLGKHSLATRNLDEARQRLRQLDRHKAADLGLAAPDSVALVSDVLPLVEGWALFEDHCKRAPVAGGIAASSWKRYRAVRDHHLKFCDATGVKLWQQVDVSHVRSFINYLHQADLSPRTQVLSGNLISQVVKFLIEDAKRLPGEQRFKLSLKRFQGSDTYCFSREEVQAILTQCRADPELEWVGHADSRIVEHYRHLSEEDARRKMNSLNLLGEPGDRS